MNQLYEQMLERIAYLERLQAEIMQDMERTPQGKLRVSNDKGKARYYQIVDAKDTHGRYLSRKEQDVACGLAQKDYLKKLYQQVREELESVKSYLVKYDECRLERVYDELNEYRKDIVVPIVVSDEVFTRRWEQESYELGIPYCYEAKLQLKNGKIKYPDFTILKADTRELIYYEHLGLLDDEGYRQASFMKLDEYRRNGIFLGKNLIITYETVGCYLNIKEIRRMIKEIVLAI